MKTYLVSLFDSAQPGTQSGNAPVTIQRDGSTFHLFEGDYTFRIKAPQWAVGAFVFVALGVLGGSWAYEVFETHKRRGWLGLDVLTYPKA